MNLCFLTIHSMTPFYWEVASRLEARGHKVSWVSPSDRWSTWLRQRSVPEGSILNMARHAREWTGDAGDRTGLAEFEAGASKSVRDLVLMDRLMVERDESPTLDYVASCVRHGGVFLKARQVDVVFAEPSYLLAYVISELSAQLGISQYAFDTVRFPDGRFGFFRGIYQSSLAGARATSTENHIDAAAYHAEFLAREERPISYYSYLQPPGLSPSLIGKVVRNVRRARGDPHDASGFPVRRMILDHLRKTWNYRAVSRWSGLTRSTSLPARPFVVYGLHKQPEVGLDVLASYLSNQEELLRVIARSLPITHDLYIKPHANDQGGRSRAFFERLVRMPQVRVADPMANSHALIRAADLVLSVTGTMAYEAGLYGRRAITFAPMFFAPILLASGVDPYSIRLRDMQELLSRPHPKDDPMATRPVDFLASIFATTYPGVVGDPLVDKRCMEPANLDLLANGFSRFLEHEAQQRP